MTRHTHTHTHTLLFLIGLHAEQDPSGYHLIREKMFPLGADGLQVLDSGGGSGQPQRLKWQAHMVNSWHEVCDGALQDM